VFFCLLKGWTHYASANFHGRQYAGSKIPGEISIDINISLGKGKAAICMEKHKKKTWPDGQVLEEEAVLFFS